MNKNTYTKNKKIKYYCLYFINIITLFLWIISPIITLIPSKAQAEFIQDNYNGYALINFLSNSNGISASDPSATRQDIEINTTTPGDAHVNPSASTGFFYTNPITPTSLGSWDKISLKISQSISLSDISVSIRECSSTNNVNSDFSNILLSKNSGPGGYFTASSGTYSMDISSIPNTNTCLRGYISITKNGAGPKVDDVKLTWSPLSVFILVLDASSSVLSGNKLKVNIAYSNSYSYSNNSVVWLPTPVPTTYSPGDVSFSSATFGGQYNNSGSSILVNGTSVPNKSVYWDLGNMQAGKSGVLNAEFNTISGTKNNSTYTTTAYADSLQSNEAVSNSKTTTISSSPSPKILKTSAGVLKIGQNNYVNVNNPSIIGYTSVVTYNIDVKNSFQVFGSEDIYTGSTVVDDLSDIYTKLGTYCGVTSLSSVISSISSGGSLNTSTKKITWTLGNLANGAISSMSFKVDYAGCPDSSVVNYSNTATFNSSQFTSVSSGEVVKVFIDPVPDPDATGGFAKGEQINGQTEIHGQGYDDLASTSLYPLTYGDTFSYKIKTNNKSSPSLIGDIIVTDKIPSGVTLQSVSSDDPNTVVYYNTSGSGNGVSVPPDYNSVTATLGGSWTTNPSGAVWVALSIPCLSSDLIPTPFGDDCYGAPVENIATITVSVDTPLSLCLYSDIENTANFQIGGYSSDLSNTTPFPGGTVLPLKFDKEYTHVIPGLPSFSKNFSIVGPTTVSPGNYATYTMSLTNTGTTPLLSPVINVTNPTLSINGGSPQVLPMTCSGSGATCPTSQTANPFNITLSGQINVGETRVVVVNVYVPIGANNTDSFVFAAKITGITNKGCSFSSSSGNDKSTSVNASPSLLIVKGTQYAVTTTASDILYYMDFQNTGNDPTSNTFVVDSVPLNTTFTEAYTSGVFGSQTYACTNCEVWFSSDSPSSGLPATLSTLNSLDPSIIYSYFTKGTESPSGTWTSGFGTNTKWIAFKVDDSTLVNKVLNPSVYGKVGFKVNNDTNPTIAGSQGSASGTLIENEAAILSDELPQGISNKVTTLIATNPGLIIDKYSDKTRVHLGEDFTWTIDYYNNSGNNDTQAVINDVFDSNKQNLIGDIEISSIDHIWNAVAIANGAPSGTQVISASGCSSSGPLSCSLNEFDFDIINHRGGNLQDLEGGKLILHMTSNPASSFVSGDLAINNVTGTYGNATLSNQQVTDTDTVIFSNPDLSITKNVNELQPLSGETIHYRLSISNSGPYEASNVVINDTLPSGFALTGTPVISGVGFPVSNAFVSIDATPIGTTGTISWPGAFQIGTNPIGTFPSAALLPGATIFIDYDVIVDAGALPATTHQNTATVSNDFTEDSIINNTASTSVTIPLPDPFAIKNYDEIKSPGDIVNYRVSFGNNSRQPVANLYAIDKLPDISVGADNSTVNSVNVQFISANISNPVSNPIVIYYHANSATTPVFVPTAPTSNGWTTSQPGTVAFIAFLRPGTTTANESFEGFIRVKLVNPENGLANLPAGVQLVNNFNAYADYNSDTANDFDTATTIIPGVDLSITKTSDKEGSFPGAKPDDVIRYTIVVKNTGTLDACGIRVNDILPGGVSFIATTAETGNYIDVTDSSTDDLADIHDQYGDPVGTKIKAIFDQNTMEWIFGNTQATYKNRCLQPNTQIGFDVFVRVDSSVVDSTILTNTVSVYEDSDSIEDYLVNNEASTSTTVFRPDLKVKKTGSSTGVTGTSTITTNPADTITYTVNYDNIGNTYAENAYIEDLIPQGTCYVNGSLTPPPGSLLKFYNSSGTEISANGCGVYKWRVYFPVMTAPSHTIGQYNDADFTGSTDGTYISNNKINLSQNNAFLASNEYISSLNIGDSYYDDDEASYPANSLSNNFVDLDGDQLPDHFGFNATSKLVVRRNTSTSTSISLGSEQIFSKGTKNGVFKDINYDGKKDFVYLSPEPLFACGTASCALNIMQNTSSIGTISFNSPISISCPADGAGSIGYPSIDNIIFTNFDHDLSDKEDIILDNYSFGCVFINNSSPSGSMVTGDFSVTSYRNDTVVDPSSPYGFSDFYEDGDVYGNKYVVSFNKTGNYVSLYVNNSTPGNVSISSPINLAGPAVLYDNTRRDYHFQDINGDGKKDLFYYNRVVNDTYIYYFINTSTSGNVSFSSYQTFDLGNNSLVKIADYDGDGLVDFLGTSLILNSASYLVVTKNTTIGSTVTGTNLLLTSEAVAILQLYNSANIDIDNDGNFDIVYQDNNSRTKVILNTSTPGNMSFGSPVTVGLDTGNNVQSFYTFGDIDHDGLADMFIGRNTGTYSGNQYPYGAYRNISTSGNVSFVPYNNRSDSSGGWENSIFGYGNNLFFKLVDVNNDGKEDLYSYGKGYGQINDLAHLIMYKNNTIPGDSTGGFVVAGKEKVAGTYDTTFVAPADFVSWNKLLVNQSLPYGAHIFYTIYQYVGSACTTNILVPKQESASGFIDISSIDDAETTLCLHVEMLDSESSSPYIDGITFMYNADSSPSLTYQVTVSASPTYTTIDNTVSIQSDNVEIDSPTLDNNTSTYTMFINQSDMTITKTVDKTVANAGDILNYTVKIKNNGPHAAYDVEVGDILPANVDVISTSKLFDNYYLNTTRSYFQSGIFATAAYTWGGEDNKANALFDNTTGEGGYVALAEDPYLVNSIDSGINDVTFLNNNLNVADSISIYGSAAYQHYGDFAYVSGSWKWTADQPACAVGCPESIIINLNLTNSTTFDGTTRYLTINTDSGPVNYYLPKGTYDGTITLTVQDNAYVSDNSTKHYVSNGYVVYSGSLASQLDSVAFTAETPVGTSVVLEGCYDPTYGACASGTFLPISSGEDLATALGQTVSDATLLYLRFHLSTSINTATPKLNDVTFRYTSANTNWAFTGVWPVGHEETVTVQVQVKNDVLVDDIVANNVSVTNYVNDNDITNNSAYVLTEIGDKPDLYINKTGVDTTTINQNISYTLDYGNTGSITATNVTIVDTIPANTTFVSANSISGPVSSCSFTTGIITCGGNGTSVNALQTGQIEIILHVDNDASLLLTGATLVNVVTISTSLSESNVSDNSSSYSTIIYSGGNASISGYAFDDADEDVIKDPGESGLSGVTVILYGIDDNGNYYLPSNAADFGDLYSDLNPPQGANIITSASIQQTNSNGLYNFTGIQSGIYNVKALSATGYTGHTGSNSTDGTGSVQGGPQIDKIVNINLSAGNSSVNNDFGYDSTIGCTTGCGDPEYHIGDLIFEDKNNNGIFDESSESGIAGVTYEIWRDINTNNIIDVSDVLVYSPVNGAISGTTLTLSSGKRNYVWTHAIQGQSYIAKITDTNNVLAGYVNTIGSIGINNNSQNSNGYATGMISSDVLVADFGFHKNNIDDGCSFNCGSIGDLVFKDNNINGKYDTGDIGFSGIGVTVFRDLNSNGVLDANENVVGNKYVAVTGIDGKYKFDNLSYGKYIVKVTDGTGVLSNAGYVWSAGLAGSVLNNESKNKDGYVVTLDSLTPDNLTADFGFKNFPNNGNGKIGDRIFVDKNLSGYYDNGDTALSGVTISLYLDLDNSGKLSTGDVQLKSTTSNSSGLYLFSNLNNNPQIGKRGYIVKVSTPSGYTHIGGKRGINYANTDGESKPLSGYNVVLDINNNPSDLTADFGFEKGNIACQGASCDCPDNDCPNDDDEDDGVDGDDIDPILQKTNQFGSDNFSLMILGIIIMAGLVFSRKFINNNI